MIHDSLNDMVCSIFFSESLELASMKLYGYANTMSVRRLERIELAMSEDLVSVKVMLYKEFGNGNLRLNEIIGDTCFLVYRSGGVFGLKERLLHFGISKK